jgi:hypothetical protein
MCLNNCPNCEECDAMDENECCKTCCLSCFDQSSADQKIIDLEQDQLAVIQGATGLSGQSLADSIDAMNKIGAKMKEIGMRNNVLFPPLFVPVPQIPEEDPE